MTRYDLYVSRDGFHILDARGVKLMEVTRSWSAASTARRMFEALDSDGHVWVGEGTFGLSSSWNAAVATKL